MQAARTHLGDKRRRYENKKPEYSKLYHTRRWIRQSKLFLKRYPLCAECLRYNVTTQAECVDHFVPHKGDLRLFWDKYNWQSLCTMHHNQKSAKEKNDY